MRRQSLHTRQVNGTHFAQILGENHVRAQVGNLLFINGVETVMRIELRPNLRIDIRAARRRGATRLPSELA